jgi:spore maturation protein CgeB
MRSLGHDVAAVRSTDVSEYRSLAARLAHRLGIARDLVGAGRQVVSLVEQESFDAIWLDKATTLSPDALREAVRRQPGLVVVSYSPDDMTIRPNRTRAFLACLPLFDAHFTTKAHNVTPLQALGARLVVRLDNAYAPEAHRPMPRTAEDRERLGGPVGFIGDYERDRAEAMSFLAANGVPVRVWGPNWARRLRRPPAGLCIEGRSLVGDDYARAICNFDVNLAFLRKAARDQQTTRSIEIPACGGFMLAERTQEHLALFEEGREAEFFGRREELLEKCRFHLAHAEAREGIAAAGRRRCVEGGYSNAARMRRMLAVVQDIRLGRTGNRQV